MELAPRTEAPMKSGVFLSKACRGDSPPGPGQACLPLYTPVPFSPKRADTKLNEIRQ